jgi:hypothetical protein
VSLGVSSKLKLLVQADFFAVFTFAHRARCAAAILLRAVADIARFLGIAAKLTSSTVENSVNAHPMKEDVKGKNFSPPLWEMRVW